MPPSVPAPAFSLAPEAPLRVPAFRWFFTGRLVSLLGSSMAPVALAFAVLDAGGDSGGGGGGRASALGLVLAAHMVPLLAFLLIGGATADRFSRRAVLVAANLGSGLTQGAVAAVLLTGHYSTAAVAGLEFLNGVLAAFTTPALRGVVPDLVGRARLRQANSLLSAVGNGTKIFGPTAAGLLVATAGSGPAIAFDAATYLAAALCLLRLPRAAGAGAAVRPEAGAGTGSGAGSGTGTVLGRVLADVRSGAREFGRIRWVWATSLSYCVLNFAQTGSWQVLGPQLARPLGGSAAWGLVLSVRGVGMLAMSLLLYRLTVRRLLAFGQTVAVLGALPLLLLGLRAPLAAVLAGACAAGLGSSAAGTAWDTSLQEHVPAHALSRVASFDDLLSYAAIPLGQLAVGPLAARFGDHAVALAATAVYAACSLTPLTLPTLRALPHTDNPEAPAT